MNDDYQHEVLDFRNSVISYGADLDVDGLVRRIDRGDIFVPAFQRGFVWNIELSSRFIESLLLGLPVPAIFLAQEASTRKLLVIDGQQRLFSLFYFYKGKFLDGKVFALKSVTHPFSGLTYTNLTPEDRRRLDNSIIHAIIVRQDDSDESMGSIYFLFERLNIGGVKLQPQEIRSALYHGEFNDLLETLNKNEHWRKIYGSLNERMRDEELILRFFGFYFERDNYQKPLTEFLNRFMARNRDLQIYSKEILSKIFLETTKILSECFGEDVFRPRKTFNVAFTEALMVGIADRLSHGIINDYNELKRKYTVLVDNDEFTSLTRVSTTDESRVLHRLTIASQTFSNVA